MNKSAKMHSIQTKQNLTLVVVCEYLAMQNGSLMLQESNRSRWKCLEILQR